MPHCKNSKNNKKESYKGTEPSPKGLGYCAHNETVGKKMKGRNGKMWIIRERANGSKYWAEDKEKTSVSKRVSNRKSKKGSKKIGKGKYIIRFCEPSTLADTRMFNTDFNLPDLSLFSKTPKIYKGSGKNAYVFGKKYKLSEYVLVGSHGNDVAQTGFVNITGATKKELGDIVSFEPWDVYRKPKYLNWDDAKGLKQIQKIFPRILFVGETVGGDVGAKLYAHYTGNKIDGLLVDNNYFFKD